MKETSRKKLLKKLALEELLFLIACQLNPADLARVFARVEKFRRQQKTRPTKPGKK